MIVAGLLGLSCLVQAVVIRRSTATGLDAVRFVGMARSIDQHGLLPAVRSERQQPLFPAWIWAVHAGLRRTMGEFPSAWAVSTQLAAAVPLVLTVVPLYFLLLRLVGSAAAAAGSFFFCLLPEVSRLGADGLSDSTHLLFFCIAFWAMVEYLGRRRIESGRGNGPFGGRTCPPLWLLLAGSATALAALARVEVLVLAGALGLTLAVFQLLPGRRQAWGKLAAASACFLLGLSLVWVPYLAAAGAVTPRAAAGRILGRHRVEAETGRPDRAEIARSWLLPNGEPMSFDVKERSVSLRQRGYAAALVGFGRKLAGVMGYWIGGLALLGAWRLRRTGTECGQGRHTIGRASDGDRFAQIFFLSFSLAAIRFSAMEGYLASRHLLGLAVAGMGAAGYGGLELGSLLGRLATAARAPLPTRRRTWKTPAVAWALVAVAGVACVPQTMVRLHHSRLGHRAAGQWLAEQAGLPGTVLDTLGWTGLYSGRQTYSYEEAPAALSDPRLAYVVLEGRETEYNSGRSRTLRWLIEAAGRPVAEFPEPAARRPNQQPVIVYRWQADRFLRRVETQAYGPIRAGWDLRPAAAAVAGAAKTGIAVSAELGINSRLVFRADGSQPEVSGPKVAIRGIGAGRVDRRRRAALFGDPPKVGLLGAHRDRSLPPPAQTWTFKIVIPEKERGKPWQAPGRTIPTQTRLSKRSSIARWMRLNWRVRSTSSGSVRSRIRVLGPGWAGFLRRGYAPALGGRKRPRSSHCRLPTARPGPCCMWTPRDVHSSRAGS